MPDNKEHKADKEISVWQKIEEILKEPSYKIAWKFDEAKKIDVKVNFKQFCIRKWAMERKIDLSSYKDSEITNNDFLKIGRKAVDDNKLQNDKDESEVDNKRIDKSILKCEKELMQCIERLYHVREKKVKL